MGISKRLQCNNSAIVFLFFIFILLLPPGYCSDSPVIRSNIPKGLQVYFATSRLNDGSRSSPSYGGSRHIDLGSGSLEYGTAALRTPANMLSPNQAQSGMQYRDLLKNDTDLWRNAKVNFIGCFEEEDFFQKVHDCTGKICIYIHGYDKPFEESLQDASMLFADYSQYRDENHQFLPILFSWPSAGGKSKYSVDEANVEWSKKSFEIFMDRLIKEKNPNATIDLVGHSMGSRLVVSYLTQEHPELQKPYLNNLFLCSADVDFHEVEAQKLKLESAVSGLIYIFVSDKDRPLIMSQLMHGEPRLGRPVDPPVSQTPDTGDGLSGIANKLGSSDFWSQLTVTAAEMWLGPECNDPPEVVAWIAQNPALDQEFGAKSRLIDDSDLAIANMGHGIAWPVISSIMAGSLEFPLLHGRAVHKRPDKAYLAQCGGKPRVLYRFIRLDPY